MRNAKKIAARRTVLACLAGAALLFGGCNSWTPASSYNTKKDLLGQSPHATTAIPQTNSAPAAPSQSQPAK